MRRRDFISLIGGAAASPLAAKAQQPAMPVVGFLNGGSPDGAIGRMLGGFHEGLKETGYSEGRNVAIEYRWANGQYDRLIALADDLVRRRVSVIAATSTPANLVAKASTSTIPIVFTTAGDPVQLGLVASLSRPGGNITGVTSLTGVVAPERVEVAHELVPTATVIGLLVNPGNPLTETLTKLSQTAADALGIELAVLHASTEAEFENAFATFSQMRAGALVIGVDALFNTHMELLAALAIRHSVPAVYEHHQFAAAGRLASYGGASLSTYHLAGIYTGRILKGEKPGDLPVQQSTKIELIINMKTAKALGLNVPTALLVRADEVIE